jgi:hypothetical protein
MTRILFHPRFVEITLLVLFLTGCVSEGNKSTPPSTLTIQISTVISPTDSPYPVTATLPNQSPPAELSGYGFPNSIHPEEQYLFYLHGKILEDQGIDAVSPDFGRYEYGAILQELANRGFTVLSEQRPKNADVNVYARKTITQVNLLLDAGVPPENITIVGASKGAYIAATVSSLLKNERVNFVLLGACNPEMNQSWLQNQMALYGNILAIYDSIDEYAGSCEELFNFSQGKGIAKHQEIVLHLGMGHGILYRPLDEWITPIVKFLEIDILMR